MAHKFMIGRAVVMLGIFAGAAAVGCSKGQDSCGSGDYIDPSKAFCIKLPTGYAASEPHKYTGYTTTTFDSATSGIEVTVQPGNFEAEAAQSDTDMKGSGRKLEQSGGTGSVRWWVYTMGSPTKLVKAIAKSPSGGLIICDSDNSVVPAEVIEACKTLRPYPGNTK